MARIISEDTIAPCGTVGCIAGWAILLSHRKGRQPISEVRDRHMQREWAWGTKSIKDEAERLLGTGNDLFLVAYWPEPFSTRYGNAASDRGRARATAQRIDHFIKTGE